jgi:hypothetical protein
LGTRTAEKKYTEAFLAGFDGGDVARDAAADDDQVLFHSLGGIAPGGDAQMACRSSKAVSEEICGHCHGRKGLGLRGVVGEELD